MKNLNLNALSQISLDEVHVVTRWLEKFPSGEITERQMRIAPPLRTSKLGAMLKVLEQFDFIVRGADHVSLSAIGRRFAQAELKDGLQIVREVFLHLQFEPAQTIAGLLQNSATGRLKRKAVSETLRQACGPQLTDSEVQGFVDWAQWVELFHYDRKRDEIVRSDQSLPTGPGFTPSRSPAA